MTKNPHKMSNDFLKSIPDMYALWYKESLTSFDCELFIENPQIEFKNYRKFGLDTILQNFEKSIIPKRYLISNIWTQIHHVDNSSSNDFNSSEELTNLKIILYKNENPKYLVQNKIKLFLQNVKKTR